MNDLSLGNAMNPRLGAFALALIAAGGMTAPVFAQDLDTPDPALEAALDPEFPVPNQGAEAEGGDGMTEEQAEAREPARELVFLPVSTIEFAYMGSTEGLMEPGRFYETRVRLVATDEGYIAPREERAGGSTCGEILDADPEAISMTIGELFASGRAIMLERDALSEISRAVFCEFDSRGLIGIQVFPDPNQVYFDRDGYVGDDRPEGQTSLTFLLRIGRTDEVRTIASGGRVATEGRINADQHRWIREHSPVQAASGDENGQLTGGLIERNALDDYVHRLNRHPGRQVDVAIAPAVRSGGAVLDLHVHERKPWAVYANLSNTGTEETDEWRVRFGVTHQQLTGRDDVLGVEYLTAMDFSSSRAISAYYDTPISADRKLRLRLFGQAADYEASEFAANLSFTGDSWTAGGELSYNVAQWGPTFLDVFGGARWFNAGVNQGFGVSGREDFFIGRAGLRVERDTRNSDLFAEVAVESSWPSVAGTGRDIDTLGRPEADGEWQLLQIELGYSNFLEPIFFGPRATTLAHEISLTGRVQYSFDDRLIPQMEQVAGGLYTVRGYPEALVAGDNLYLASLEYRLHLPRLMPVRPNQKTRKIFGEDFRVYPDRALSAPDWDFIIRPFTDFAQVETSRSVAGDLYSEKTLWSAGIGAELRLMENISARADWGFALLDVDTGTETIDAGDNRVHFSFTILF